MKKLFLIPLMACFTCVMAWGATVEVGTFAELKSAINSASDGDVIKLTGNITGSTSNSSANVLNITKSITIDGQGNTLKNCGNYSVFRVNQGVASPQFVTITIKDLKMIQPEGDDYGIASNSSLGQLTLENCDISCAAGGNPHGIIIGGPAPEGGSKLIIKNTHINATASGYPIRVFSPMDITMEDSQTEGYCGVYFARAANGYAGSEGPRGTTVIANNCNFDAPNVHTYAGGWNNFGVFTMEDGNITINLHNCGMNSEETGFAKQGMILAEASGCIVNISGDNSHINGKMVLMDDEDDDPGYWLAFLALNGDLSITGGTYSVDPSHYGPFNPFTSFGSQVPTLPNEDMYANFVPEGYEVNEITMEGVATPLYRVAKKAATKTGAEEGTLYNLNELVTGEGTSAGVNPTSSFAVVDSIVLEQPTTKAGYVAVGDTATTGTKDSVTVTVPTNKTFVISNGLDVRENAQVIAEPQSTIIVGEGGIITDNAESIVIEADANGSAALLLDPDITVNQTPDITVKMYTSVGKDHDNNESYWHRFAIPVHHLTEVWTKEPSAGSGTWLYGWDYSSQDWTALGTSTDMAAFKGYTLTHNLPYNSDTQTGTQVIYTFKGPMAGNISKELSFVAGYNFFGNSFTGAMSIVNFMDSLKNGNVDGSVWMWNPTQQNYIPVPINDLKENEGNYEDWQKEVAPMHTFIMRLATGESATELLDYRSAIWGNPKYGNVPATAPARVTESGNNTYIRINVTASNGQSDMVTFTENANRSEEYEWGYDATKFMTERTINIYSTNEDQDLSAIATNNLSGKTITLSTNKGIDYELSFSKVNGNVAYAIKDMLTNTIIPIAEGSTYSFVAQPNSVDAGRFMIIPMQNMPTDVENVEPATVGVKGIYSIMGQYMGETSAWETLPTGVYVVDGVKVVK